MFYYNYLTFYCHIILKYVNYIYNNIKNRSRTEIVSNIHDAANRRATKIKIMYIAFLSYSQLKEYLPVLIENNLIEYHNGTQTFRTTKKGLKFLKTYDEMEELLQTTTIKNSN